MKLPDISKTASLQGSTIIQAFRIDHGLIWYSNKESSQRSKLLYKIELQGLSVFFEFKMTDKLR
jgi:hypothetical protein